GPSGSAIRPARSPPARASRSFPIEIVDLGGGRCKTDGMGVEFIGIARTADGSDAVTEVGPPVQPDYLYRLARAHERSGFDQLLVTAGAAGPDAFIVAD